MLCLFVGEGFVLMWDPRGNGMWNGDMKDCRYEKGKGTDVIKQILIRKGFPAVAVPSHCLYGDTVMNGNMVFLTEVVNLREQVPVGLIGVTYALMTCDDEDLVKGVLW